VHERREIPWTVFIDGQRVEGGATTLRATAVCTVSAGVSSADRRLRLALPHVFLQALAASPLLQTMSVHWRYNLLSSDFENLKAGKTNSEVGFESVDGETINLSLLLRSSILQFVTSVPVGFSA